MNETKGAVPAISLSVDVLNVLQSFWSLVILDSTLK
jgi:hypothetical protein